MAFTDSLISFWELEEASGTRNDAHGTNHLTDNNTVLSATGKVGTAADFESTQSEFLSRADNASLSTGNIDFTLAAWVKFESKPAGGAGVVAKWHSTDGLREYGIAYAGTGFDRFYFFVHSNGFAATVVIVLADVLGAPSTGVWYHVVAWHDSVGNTINIQVNNGTANTVSHSAGVADTAGDFLIGTFGVSYWDGLIDQVGFWKRVLTADERTSLYNSGAGLAYADLLPLTVGTASFTSSTETTISVSATAATSGTGSKTYQWYRALVSGFTPGAGNILSGATSLTLNDSASLTAGVVYFYKLVATDATAATVTYNQISGSLWRAYLKIGFLGDSLTDGSGVVTKPGTLAAELLERIGGLRQVTATNQGVNGSQTSEWVSGQAILTAALSAFASAGVSHVVVTLGTNDSADVYAVSNSTFTSNMTSLVNALTGAGYTVILNHPPGYKPGATATYSEAGLERLNGYRALLTALVNGTTVKAGDTSAFSYFASFTGELVADGVHFTETGNTNWSAMLASAIEEVLNQSAGGGSIFGSVVR